MNTPNKITVFRIILVPVFLLFYTVGIPYKYFISLAVFAVASLTDAVDGHLARKYNQITDFGKFLDPVADKMLVTAGLLAFMSDELCNVWIVMVILIREFLISSFRMIAAAQGVVISASIFGKIKTVVQMVSFFAILLLLAVDSVNELNVNIVLISNILLGISAVIGVFSAVVYFKDGLKKIDFTK